MPIGFCTSMWTMKNQKLLPSAFQNFRTSAGRRTGLESSEADEDPLLVDLGVKRQAKRVEQRKDHHGGVDQHRRGQENHEDVPADSRAAMTDPWV